MTNLERMIALAESLARDVGLPLYRRKDRV
jgi:hypothetical protein